MRSNVSGALAISALLHAAVVGLVLFFSFAAARVVQDTPKVFELVAGAGDNYAATAAPALGSRGASKAAQKPVDMLTELKRAEQRRERRMEAQYKKEEEAERRRMAQEELEREQAAAKEASRTGERVKHIDAEGIRAFPLD